jgi:hypothetical protein
VLINISLTGEEPPVLVRALSAALNFLAEQLTGLQATPSIPVIEPAAEAPKAEAPAETKPRATRKAKVTESEETKTVDNTTVLAAVEADDAKEARAAERAAAAASMEVKESLGEIKQADPLSPEALAPVQAEEGKPAAEITVEQLRELGKSLNTPEQRAVAKQILTSHGVKSITELGERENIVRVSVYNEFIRAAA